MERLLLLFCLASLSTPASSWGDSIGNGRGSDNDANSDSHIGGSGNFCNWHCSGKRLPCEVRCACQCKEQEHADIDVTSSEYKANCPMLNVLTHEPAPTPFAGPTPPGGPKSVTQTVDSILPLIAGPGGSMISALGGAGGHGSAIRQGTTGDGGGGGGSGGTGGGNATAGYHPALTDTTHSPAKMVSANATGAYKDTSNPSAPKTDGGSAGGTDTSGAFAGLGGGKDDAAAAAGASGKAVQGAPGAATAGDFSSMGSGGGSAGRRMHGTGEIGDGSAGGVKDWHPGGVVPADKDDIFSIVSGAYRMFEKEELHK